MRGEKKLCNEIMATTTHPKYGHKPTPFTLGKLSQAMPRAI